MADIIVRFAIMAVVPIIIFTIFTNIQNSNESTGKNTVHLPKTYFWIGFISTLVISIMTFIMYAFSNGTEADWVGMGLMLFILLSISLMLAGLNLQISYSDEGFRYRTFIGKSYTFSHNDIKNIKRTNNGIRIYTQKRCLYIDPYAIGTSEFFEAVNKAQIQARNK